MKKIIIEISDNQHEEMKAFLEKRFSSSVQEESCFADYTIKLNVSVSFHKLMGNLWIKIRRPQLLIFLPKDNVYKLNN